MNVLSLFDGISACHLALTRAGIDVDTYYTAEIDKYATQISEHHYPDAIRFGDVTKWQEWDIDWSSIDLVTGGFPCQAWSVAGKQLGDKDERGMLFWTMLDIMKMVLKHNPKAYFLMENVKMKKEFEQYITHHTEQALGQVEKHLINSALVSAQNRNRYYWTNIQGITQPEDKGLILADVIESGLADREKSLTVTTRVAGDTEKRYLEKSMHQMVIDRGSHLQDFISTPHPDFKGGNQLNPNYKSQANTIHDPSKKAPTICAGTHGYALCHIPVRPCEPREFNANSLCHHAATATDLNGNDSIKRVYAETGKAPTLTTMGGGHREPKVLIVPEATKKGYVEIEPGQCVDMTFPNSKTRRGRKMENKSNCLTAASFDYNHWNGHTYRKLTPLECERLQTFPDNWTLAIDENGKQLVSNTQRYKALGNAWTVDVIAHIFSFMKPQTMTLEAGLFIPKGTQLTLEFYDELNKVAVA